LVGRGAASADPLALASSSFGVVASALRAFASTPLSSVAPADKGLADPAPGDARLRIRIPQEC
jgi:hypothetical protein